MDAIDAVTTRHGRSRLAPARMPGTAGTVRDRVSFGSVKALEGFLFDGTEGEVEPVPSQSPLLE